MAVRLCDANRLNWVAQTK